MITARNRESVASLGRDEETELLVTQVRVVRFLQLTERNGVGNLLLQRRRLEDSFQPLLSNLRATGAVCFPSSVLV